VSDDIWPLPCLLVLGSLAYVVGQTSVFLRLWGLLRQQGAIMTPDLARRCVFNLGVMPWIMLVLLSALVPIVGMPNQDPLSLLAFSPQGTAFALTAWIGMGAWMSGIIRKPKRLYRGAFSLVPIVVLGLICLTYSAGVAWVLGSEIYSAQGPGRTLRVLTDFGAMFLFYIPTAPLVGLVLLIIHVWRMLPSGGPVTMGASGNESKSEGDVS